MRLEIQSSLCSFHPWHSYNCQHLPYFQAFCPHTSAISNMDER
ncbi:hypothetical protein AVEN_169716-1, partial [Araneus ventricosus]